MFLNKYDAFPARTVDWGAEGFSEVLVVTLPLQQDSKRRTQSSLPIYSCLLTAPAQPEDNTIPDCTSLSLRWAAWSDSYDRSFLVERLPAVTVSSHVACLTGCKKNCCEASCHFTGGLKTVSWDISSGFAFFSDPPIRKTTGTVGGSWDIILILIFRYLHDVICGFYISQSLYARIFLK